MRFVVIAVAASSPIRCIRRAAAAIADAQASPGYLLALVNERRAQGADCGSFGHRGAAPALRLAAPLINAARAHAREMAQYGYVAHANLRGERACDRARAAGYRGAQQGSASWCNLVTRPREDGVLVALQPLDVPQQGTGAMNEVACLRTSA
jgi:uncharacterized protein YkwD